VVHGVCGGYRKRCTLFNFDGFHARRDQDEAAESNNGGANGNEREANDHWPAAPVYVTKLGLNIHTVQRAQSGGRLGLYGAVFKVLAHRGRIIADQATQFYEWKADSQKPIAPKTVNAAPGETCTFVLID
jgi:hypothetical protein